MKPTALLCCTKRPPHLGIEWVPPHVADTARVGSPEGLGVLTLDVDGSPNAHVLHRPVEHCHRLPDEAITMKTNIKVDNSLVKLTIAAMVEWAGV